jgi:hypothetical protein
MAPSAEAHWLLPVYRKSSALGAHRTRRKPIAARCGAQRA